ncbi:hypothetical protein HDU90_005599 [Geranomyces variabilis]|nr:hypothetical protein HDU90_005599 [Geranomyces variabilis]
MDNDAALGPFSLLPPTYQAQLHAALLSQVDDVATSEARTSFPGDEPEGELDNAISLLRTVMKMPLFHQTLGQEDAPPVSFRETLNTLLVDGTRSRYNLAPRDGDNVDVATEAVKLVKMVFTDIQFDASLEQLVETLNVLTAGAGAGASVNTTKLARLRELVDETYTARPWEMGHWNDGQQIREYFEHKFAEFLN